MLSALTSQNDSTLFKKRVAPCETGSEGMDWSGVLFEAD